MKQEAENCIRGLVSQKYEAGFARVSYLPTVAKVESDISCFVKQESFNARLKTLADPNSTNIYVSNLPRSMTEKVRQPARCDRIGRG
jgi:hypothetical protein